MRKIIYLLFISTGMLALARGGNATECESNCACAKATRDKAFFANRDAYERYQNTKKYEDKETARKTKEILSKASQAVWDICAD